jgi:hypothetical protein
MKAFMGAILGRAAGRDVFGPNAEAHPPEREGPEAAERIGLANGTPLSVRITRGRPYARNSRSKVWCAEATAVDARAARARHPSKKWLYRSRTVSGKQYGPPRNRNSPLKSAVHTAFASSATVRHPRGGPAPREIGVGARCARAVRAATRRRSHWATASVGPDSAGPASRTVSAGHPRDVSSHRRCHAVRLGVPRVRPLGERRDATRTKSLQPLLSSLFTNPKLRTDFNHRIELPQTGLHKR